ncbi:hypothetical protein GCM10023084_55980 [Streptomyces lacrimifluminis]|uniref:Uncharacterized protein n=1 Tax=Streptomyces lacrimifluminis TaxID=1500077 RepID=A0A917KJ87_9ACTN|nr:hypothetical protein GCM10012282_10550 [Streptomyces lacrimifluminis]
MSELGIRSRHRLPARALPVEEMGQVLDGLNYLYRDMRKCPDPPRIPPHPPPPARRRSDLGRTRDLRLQLHRMTVIAR